MMASVLSTNFRGSADEAEVVQMIIEDRDEAKHELPNNEKAFKLRERGL